MTIRIDEPSDDKIRVMRKNTVLEPSSSSDKLITKNRSRNIVTYDAATTISSPKRQTRYSANRTGFVENVQVGSTVEIVKFVTQSSYLIYGFNGPSTGDTFYELKIDGNLEASYLTNVINKNADFKFSSAKFLPSGVEVVLTGKNFGNGPSRMDGIIQGEDIING